MSETVNLCVLLFICGGIVNMTLLMNRMRDEMTGTASSLRDHDRRLEIIEKELANVTQLVTSMYARSPKD